MVCFQVACTENSHLSFCTGADRNHVRTAFFIGSPAVRQRGPGWAAYAPEKLLLTSCPYSPGTPGRLQASQDARRAVEARGFFEPCWGCLGFHLDHFATADEGRRARILEAAKSAVDMDSLLRRHSCTGQAPSLRVFCRQGVVFVIVCVNLRVRTRFSWNLRVVTRIFRRTYELSPGVS